MALCVSAYFEFRIIVLKKPLILPIQYGLITGLLMGVAQVIIIYSVVDPELLAWTQGIEPFILLASSLTGTSVGFIYKKAGRGASHGRD
jgi:hypothetical protein